MSIAAGAPGWLVIVLLLLLAVAAIEDGWRLRISNLVVIAIAVSGGLAIVLAGIGWASWQPLLLSVAILIVGTLMFARGWIGGGDVKLLAASACWFTFQTGWKMLVAVAIAGGVLALVALVIRRLAIPATVRERIALLRRGSGIPYGIAIAAGVAATILTIRSSLG